MRNTKSILVAYNVMKYSRKFPMASLRLLTGLDVDSCYKETSCS
jgi:hypothetical protein